jgi:hypothetical protein
MRSFMAKNRTKARGREKSKASANAATSPPLDWRDIRLTTDEAGAAVKMSGERVRQLTKAGWIKKSGSNAYRIGDVLDGYLAYRDDLEQKAAADTPQARLAATKRQAIEQRMAREDGRLVPIEEVAAGITDILGTYRSELSGVPAASTRDPEVRSAIESNLNGAIERCRARFQAMEGDLRAGREVKLDGDEADA